MLTAKHRLRDISCTWKFTSNDTEPKPRKIVLTKTIKPDRLDGLDMSANYHQNGNRDFRPRREGRRGTPPDTAVPVAAPVHAVYAIAEDIEYLASSAFDAFDINQIIEGVPQPWAPENMTSYHGESHSPALSTGERLPIRSPPASKFNYFFKCRPAFVQLPCQILISAV
jgi:hypothetical protein